MLPCINTQQGLVSSNHRVLIGKGLDGDVSCLSVLDQPSPTAALDSGQSSIELLLHVFQTSICAVDGLGQFSRGRFTTSRVLGSQILPKESVIDVTAAVEVDQRLQSNFGSDIVVGFSGRVLIGGIVVGVHVGLVMFTVMKFHDLARNGRLESTIVILVYLSAFSRQEV